MDRVATDKGIKYLVYKKRQRMLNTVRSVMHNELTDYEREIATEYWCDNLLVDEIAKKHNLSRSAFYRTVKNIEKKINLYLKYVVFYSDDAPPTKGDFLAFLRKTNLKGEFFEN